MAKNLNVPNQIIVANFYHFCHFPNYEDFQAPVQILGDRHQLKGIVLLAAEGINATVAGSRADIDAFLDFWRSLASFTSLEHKESTALTFPYQKFRVRLRTELIKFGAVDPHPQVGIYVQPQDWNALICDPEVLVLDTRNIYEVEIGTFQGAVNPQLTYFKEFPEFVAANLANHQQKIAMFCTGGIRCEKASAYLLRQGFSEVYHLQGGILKYLAEVPPGSSLWQGECFMFDDRISL